MATLKSQAPQWAGSAARERAALLKEVRRGLLPLVGRLSAAEAVARGGFGDERVLPGCVAKNALVIAGFIDALVPVLEAVERTGAPPAPSDAPRDVGDGRQVVRVWPPPGGEPMAAKASAGPKTCDLYLQPGKPASQGKYAETHGGKVCVVLGAGNQLFLSIIDVMQKIFVDGCTVMLKYHDIAKEAGAMLDDVFAPLRKAGYYYGTSADIPTCQSLVYSEHTDCVHLTGSIATHEALLWGTADPAEQAKLRAAGAEPKLKVPFTSELGCITPWIIVPDEVWTEKDVVLYAKHLAASVLDNAGCNCLSPRVMFLAKSWSWRERFVVEFKKAVASAPISAPYYPGIHARHARWLEAHPDAELIEGPYPAGLGEAFGKPLPLAVNFYDGIPQEPEKDVAFTEEAFCPVFSFVDVHAATAEDFLASAVRFCNDHLWGDLSTTLIIHPETEAARRDLYERAIGDLRYGVVCVNAWSALAYSPDSNFWGGWQGEGVGQGTLAAGRHSGVGGVLNVKGYDHIEKAVVHMAYAGPSVKMITAENAPSLGFMKSLAGLVLGGFYGLLKMWFTPLPAMPKRTDLASTSSAAATSSKSVRIASKLAHAEGDADSDEAGDRIGATRDKGLSSADLAQEIRKSTETALRASKEVAAQ